MPTLLNRAPKAEEDQDESRESNIFAYSVIEDTRPVAITAEKISLVIQRYEPNNAEASHRIRRMAEISRVYLQSSEE